MTDAERESDKIEMYGNLVETRMRADKAWSEMEEKQGLSREKVYCKLNLFSNENMSLAEISNLCLSEGIKAVFNEFTTNDKRAIEFRARYIFDMNEAILAEAERRKTLKIAEEEK